MLGKQEWSTYRKLLFTQTAGGGSMTEYTTEGNPLTFNTNKAKPLRKALVTWTPRQEGTGDPSPENIRPVVGMDGVNVWHTGKNVVEFEVTEKTTSVYYNGYSGWCEKLTDFNNLVGTKLTYSVFIDGTQQTETVNNKAKLWAQKTDGTWQYAGLEGNYIPNGTSGISSVTVTIGADLAWIAFGLGLEINGIARNPIVCVGETASEYEPYTGQTFPVEFPVLGKNLFNKDAGTVGVWWKGNVLTGGQYDNFTASEKIPVIPGETYTIIRNSTGQGAVCFFDDNGTYINQTTDWTNVRPTQAVPEGVYFIAFNVVTEDVGSAMMNKGSTALPYEPYTRTCYGGTLDLTTGVLTATYMQKVSDGSIADEWTFGTNAGLYRAVCGRFGDDKPKASSTNTLKTNYFASSSNASKGNAYISSTQNFLCYVPDGITTKEDWLAYLAENSLQIVYELATPVVLATLSPTQISAFLGNNTMWADADNLSVTYLKKG